MLTVSTIAQAREAFAALARPLAFVPTMGALHAGHLALVAAVRDDCASLGASVFVNPLQFGAGEDLARYPRDPSGDAARLRAAGVAVLFAPDAAEMYPPGFATHVEVDPLGAAFEGIARPGHFRGVATVVLKLLQIVAPDVVVLGQKDLQQTAVIRRMVTDLALPVEVRIVPTVREPDGLALSSRNAYLSPSQRVQAPMLARALAIVRDRIRDGVAKADALAAGRRALADATAVDYLDVVDARTFEPRERAGTGAFAVGAIRLGDTRLIDNLAVEALS